MIRYLGNGSFYYYSMLGSVYIISMLTIKIKGEYIKVTFLAVSGIMAAEQGRGILVFPYKGVKG